VRGDSCAGGAGDHHCDLFGVRKQSRHHWQWRHHASHGDGHGDALAVGIAGTPSGSSGDCSARTVILPMLTFALGVVVGVVLAISWVFWRLRGIEWDRLTGR
jgi:hypothetical protein